MIVIFVYKFNKKYNVLNLYNLYMKKIFILIIYFLNNYKWKTAVREEEREKLQCLRYLSFYILSFIYIDISRETSLFVFLVCLAFVLKINSSLLSNSYLFKSYMEAIWNMQVFFFCFINFLKAIFFFFGKAFSKAISVTIILNFYKPEIARCRKN